jgi:hypothetical protein
LLKSPKGPPTRGYTPSVVKNFLTKVCHAPLIPGALAGIKSTIFNLCPDLSAAAANSFA